MRLNNILYITATQSAGGFTATQSAGGFNFKTFLKKKFGRKNSWNLDFFVAFFEKYNQEL